MSTRYEVSIDLVTKGNLDDKLGSAGSKLSGLDSGISKLRDGFTGLVEKAGDVAVSVAKWAAVGTFGAVAYGVTKINNELEKTQISLAAIFGANGFSKNMSEGMDLAAGTMAKMRTDAAALPGEFGDLMNIFRAISVPGFQSGASIEKLEDFSAKTMAVGAVMNLPQEVVAREMAMLLEGRAGAHNMLGLRLAGLGGDQAKAFNQKSGTERLAFLSKELEKYAGAIDVYRHSFDGLSSTFIDNVKNFGRQALGGLFDGIKGTLETVNAWFDRNQLQIATFASALGTKLLYAWELGTTKIAEWWPAIETFVENAYARLVQIWEKIQPYVERFGSALQNALKDPGTIDKIERILELYAAVKIGGGILDMAGGMKGLGSLVGGAGSLLGGAGKVLGAGGADLGAAGMEGLYGGALALRTWTAGLGESMLAMAPAAAMFGAIAAAGIAWYGVWDESTKLQAEINDQFQANRAAYKDAGEHMLKFADGQDYLNYASRDYQGVMARLIDTGNELQASLLMADGAAREFAKMHEVDNDKRRGEFDQFSLDRLTVGTMAAVEASTNAAAKKPPKHPGGAGVHINRVEINVASNEDPSRIAYKVADIFTGWKRNPRTSQYAPNNFAASLP